MEGAMTVLYAAVTAMAAAAAILAGTGAYLSLKTARGGEPGHFNIRYRYEYGAEFCRAHLVGRACRLGDGALYLVEIHPGDAAKAYAWTVSETGLRGAFLLERGKFYKLAFKEELYD